jgi:glyoxylase-like metal-dependent hydrolase (beta-lactamase superfamily II)
VNFTWERLGDGVARCRLPFLDVTVGLVHGRAKAMLIDTGSTLTEARAIADDVCELAGHCVSHILLSHNHFDHVLGSSAFDAEIYCAPEVAATISQRTDRLRADALSHGADAADVERAIAALRTPEHCVRSAVVDLGGREVAINHPGRGHTDHDLIAVVTGEDPTIVFCGDLVEESGDPCIEADSDVQAWPATLEHILAAGGENAVYVPGHGAIVDADFVRRQQAWLRERV